MAILLMAIAGVSLASTGEGDTSLDSSVSTNSTSTDTYAEGAFNFTENSQQDVESNISGQAIVHGDSSANVAGSQYNCSVEGACNSGDNSGVQQNLTVNGGNITDGNTLGGHYIAIEVPVYTYEEQFTRTSVASIYDVVTAIDFDPSDNLAIGEDPRDVKGVAVGDILGGKSLGFSKVQATNADGSPKTMADNQWVGYNSTEAALIQSNNNVAAQKIAANANTTQTVISAPSMSAPSINASNSDMCRHGVSGSGSMVGLGFSAGVTLIDKNCELLKQVRLLSNLGLKDVALALLGQDERVALAMFQADPERYSQFLNADTVRDLEEDSANAEAVVNGEEVKYQNADADQEIIDGDVNGSDDDNKQAKSLGANGYPIGDLLNLPIFNWLN